MKRGERKKTCRLGHPLRFTKKARYCPICVHEKNKIARAKTRQVIAERRLKGHHRFRFVIEGELAPLIGLPANSPYGAIYDMVSRLQIGATIITSGFTSIDDLTKIQAHIFQMRRTKENFKGKDFESIRNRGHLSLRITRIV